VRNWWRRWSYELPLVLAVRRLSLQAYHPSGSQVYRDRHSGDGLCPNRSDRPGVSVRWRHPDVSGIRGHPPARSRKGAHTSDVAHRFAASPVCATCIEGRHPPAGFADQPAARAAHACARSEAAPRSRSIRRWPGSCDLMGCSSRGVTGVSKPPQVRVCTTVDRGLDLTARNPDIAQSAIVQFMKRFRRGPALQIRGQAIGQDSDPADESAQHAGTGRLC
jgi:hypothetical protein